VSNTAIYFLVWLLILIALRPGNAKNLTCQIRRGYAVGAAALWALGTAFLLLGFKLHHWRPDGVECVVAFTLFGLCALGELFVLGWVYLLGATERMDPAESKVDEFGISRPDL